MSATRAKNMEEITLRQNKLEEEVRSMHSMIEDRDRTFDKRSDELQASIQVSIQTFMQAFMQSQMSSMELMIDSALKKHGKVSEAIHQTPVLSSHGIRPPIYEGLLPLRVEQPEVSAEQIGDCKVIDKMSQSNLGEVREEMTTGRSVFGQNGSKNEAHKIFEVKNLLDYEGKTTAKQVLGGQCDSENSAYKVLDEMIDSSPTDEQIEGNVNNERVVFPPFVRMLNSKGYLIGTMVAKMSNSAPTIIFVARNQLDDVSSVFKLDDDFWFSEIPTFIFDPGGVMRNNNYELLLFVQIDEADDINECSVLPFVSMRDFGGYTITSMPDEGSNPNLTPITSPKGCLFQHDNQVIFEWKATSRGNQFDWIFGVWISRDNILWSCLATLWNGIFVWDVISIDSDDIGTSNNVVWNNQPHDVFLVGTLARVYITFDKEAPRLTNGRGTDIYVTAVGLHIFVFTGRGWEEVIQEGFMLNIAGSSLISKNLDVVNMISIATKLEKTWGILLYHMGCRSSKFWQPLEFSQKKHPSHGDSGQGVSLKSCHSKGEATKSDMLSESCVVSNFTVLRMCPLYIVAGSIELTCILEAVSYGPVAACKSQNSTMMGIGVSRRVIEPNLIACKLKSERVGQECCWRPFGNFYGLSLFVLESIKPIMCAIVLLTIDYCSCVVCMPEIEAGLLLLYNAHRNVICALNIDFDSSLASTAAIQMDCVAEFSFAMPTFDLMDVVEIHILLLIGQVCSWGYVHHLGEVYLQKYDTSSMSARPMDFIAGKGQNIHAAWDDKYAWLSVIMEPLTYSQLEHILASMVHSSITCDSCDSFYPFDCAYKPLIKMEGGNHIIKFEESVCMELELGFSSSFDEGVVAIKLTVFIWDPGPFAVFLHILEGKDVFEGKVETWRSNTAKNIMCGSIKMIWKLTRVVKVMQRELKVKIHE